MLDASGLRCSPGSTVPRRASYGLSPAATRVTCGALPVKIGRDGALDGHLLGDRSSWLVDDHDPGARSPGLRCIP